MDIMFYRNVSEGANVPELETERRTGDKCFEGDIYGSNRLVVSRVVYGLVITIKIVQHYPAGVKTRDLPWFDHEDA